MNAENKIIGYRKMGLGIATVTALIWKPPEDFGIAIIVGIIAIVGIGCQTWLDKEEDNAG